MLQKTTDNSLQEYPAQEHHQQQNKFEKKLPQIEDFK